jgi:ribosomal protein L29
MSELSRKNDPELRKTLFEKRRLWHEFRFGAAGSRIRNTREGRHLRRDIARILTEIRKRNSPAKPTDAATTPAPEADTKK